MGIVHAVLWVEAQVWYVLIWLVPMESLDEK